MKPCLRISAAAVTLILLSTPPPAASDPTCLEKPLPVNARIRTSLGTIELCLIDHDIDTDDGSAAWQISRITNAFLDAADDGEFDNSFFHIADKCPEWEEPYCAAPAVKIHGGKFRVSAEHDIEATSWTLNEGKSVLQNTRGTISVVGVGSGSTATADWFINVDRFNWRAGRLETPRTGHPFGVVVKGMQEIVDKVASLTTVNTARPPSRLYVRQAESACLSGDDTGDSEACVCNDANRTDGSCVNAGTDYLKTLRELWVREDGANPACIVGDEEGEAESCNCEPLAEGGEDPCVPFDEYRSNRPSGCDLWVRQNLDNEDSPCLSETPAATCGEGLPTSCLQCAGPPCEAAQSYLGTLLELWVRDDGSDAPCIHGDDDDDPIVCPCSDADQGNGTCVRFGNYIDGKALEVRLAHPACLSGDVDADEDDACTCRAIDVEEDRCRPADDYALEHPELQVVIKGGEACLTGDVTEDAGEEVPGEETEEDRCTCEDGDTCRLLHDYVDDNDYYQRIRPREEACIGTGDSDPDCRCTDTEQTDGTCQEAEDYLQDSYKIMDADTEKKCIFGDDDPPNEACVCEGPLCKDGDAYLEEYPGSDWIRVPIPACVSSITTDDQGDGSCPCDVAGEPACQSALDYVRQHLNMDENDPDGDWQIPLDYYGADPIVNINSTTLVMIDAIPEPGSLGLEASALVALGLLAGRRRRRHRTR
jgi:hypothetical protein